MTVHVRDAATEDIGFLAAMLLEAVNWRQDQPPSTLQSIMKNPELGMGVARTHRGHGVGRVLLERTIRAAADRGLQGLSLSVEDENERARALYVSNGFVIAGRVGKSDTMILRF